MVIIQMEFTKKILFLFSIIFSISFSFSLHAQDEQFKIVYLSPLPGSIYNLPQTNIIIATNDLIDENNFLNNSELIVLGSKSGQHTGELIVSDDRKTIVFNANLEFFEEESITVQLRGVIKAQNGKVIDSLAFKFWVNKANYKFQISSNYMKEFENNFYANSSKQNQNYEVNAQSNLDSLPSDFPKFRITVRDNPDSDYIFIGTTSAINPYIMILDNNGNPVYYKRTRSGTYDFKVQPNGWLTYYDMKSSFYYAMDSSYNLVDSFKCGNGYYTDLHELRLLPNGHALILGVDTKTMDMSRLVIGGSTTALVIGSVVQELDKNKNVVFQWLCWDYINVIDTYTDPRQNSFDFSHGNAIELDDDGNLLVSFRNLQEITKIDRGTGNIIWRLGGRKNQFNFLNDTIGFSWQHAVRRLANGNILLFDNGFRRNNPSIMFTRVVEYKLDEKLKTAELIWQCRNNPDVYSIGLGYAQRLKNGNTFIGWGYTFPTITEVRPDGTKAFEMSFKDNLFTYRAYRFPWKSKYHSLGKLEMLNLVNTFKPVAINDTTSVLVVIKNTHDKPIAINSIKNHSTIFYTPLNFPVTIPAGNFIDLKIFFKPIAIGYFSDTLEIDYDSGKENILLFGESPAPVITANANELDFGDVLINQTVSKQILITNSSVNKLVIDSLTIRTRQFITPKISLPYSIKSGDTLKLQISFKPDSLITYSDSLFVYTNSDPRIYKIILKGNAILTGITAQQNLAPKEFSLKQNFPNPFNQSTIIQYEISEQVKVKVNIYNLLGQNIKTLVDEIQPAGYYSMKWKGTDNSGVTVCSGVYVYRIQAGNYILSRKMLMLN